MILETNNKRVQLVYKTKKIVNLTNGSEGKSFEELYFEALNRNDLNVLAKIIYVFAEDVDTGLGAFKNEDDACDFIDEYKAKDKKPYIEIFKEIAEDINKEGFFTRVMTAEEMEERMSSLSSIQMDKIIEKSAGEAVKTVATEIFKGYVG